MAADVLARRLGRLSAAERAHELVADAETIEGCIVGRDAALSVIATDGRVARGVIGASVAARLAKEVRSAAHDGRALVLLLDSDGADAGQGLAALHANGDWLAALADASGHVPLVAVIFGFVAGSAAYAAALCDVVVMINERSFAFVAGPALVRSAIGEHTDPERLGGTTLHSEHGFVHLLAADDRHALGLARAALSYLGNATTRPARAPSCAPRASSFTLPPTTRTYDAADVIAALADAHTYLALAPFFGPSIQVGLARIDGHAVLLVASQPLHLAGALDAAAAQKLARFVRLASAFNLPVVTVCDTPGFLPGSAEEQRRVLVHGAKVISAYAEARRTVPLVAVVLRRAVGAGTVLVHGADVVLACDGAEMVQMGGIPTNRYTATVAPGDLRAALVDALGHVRHATPAPAGQRKHSLVPL